MDRRKFIINTSLAAFFPGIISFLSSCTNTVKAGKKGGNKIMVFIQLNGGNDGLNTLIPLNNYNQFTQVRPNLYIPESKILTLKGQTASGLHPSLGGIQDLYNNGLASFVQGVGYENPNYSHFRSADIWLTGSEADKVLYSGWMGRWLENKYKGYPMGFPSQAQPDPPGIKIGDTGTYMFQGTDMDLSIIIDPIEGLHAPELEPFADDTHSLAGEQIKSIRSILTQTQAYSGAIQNALGTSFIHSKLYPETGTNPLADQLKMVAKLINGGLQTQVYLVELKGFDTHDAQADPKNTTKGLHADLLNQLSTAITCFWDDVVKMNREDDVAGMTFSEFGRRIMSNASYGTDHGSSQPLLFFGNSLNMGIIGTNPVIPDKVTVDDNLANQYDFRAVYASILKNWLSTPTDNINHILQGPFNDIDIFKNPAQST